VAYGFPMDLAMTDAINNNSASLFAQQALASTQVTMAREIASLSSGKRINGAADDPASLAISQGLVSQISAVNQTH